MNFTVTYRGSDGALRKVCIEASGRTECVEKCRVQGIMPISVKNAREDDGDSKNAFTSGIKGFYSKKMIWLIAGMLAIGSAVLSLMQGGDGRNADKRGKAAAEESLKKRNEPKPVSQATQTSVVTNIASATATNAIEKVQKPREKRNVISIHTNNLGKIVEKWIDANGRKRMSVKYARKPVFDNASDDQLAMAVGGGGTQAIAPIPMTAASEAEFLKSLERPIVISEDDSEQVKRLKEAVRNAREAMKQLMDDGMSYREALAEHQKTVNENVDTRNVCAAELKVLVDAGDREGAEQYIKTMNIALEQMGIEPLSMPMSRDELNAAREKRRQERINSK